MKDSIKLLAITAAVILSVAALVSSFDYSSSLIYGTPADLGQVNGTGGGGGYSSGSGNAGMGRVQGGSPSNGSFTGGASGGIAGSSGKDIDNSFLKLIAGFFIYIASKLSALIPSLAVPLGGFGSWLEPHDIPPSVTVPPQSPVTGSPSASAPTHVIPAANSLSDLAMPMAVLLLVLLAISIVVLKKYHIPLIKKTQAPAAMDIPDPAQDRASMFEGSYRLSFPMISEPFPLLWGTGEALDIVVAGKDGIREIASVTIDGAHYQDITLEDGAAHITITMEKGRHRIEFAPKEGAAGPSWVEVRIVDYREEVVGIFNAMYGRFRTGVAGIKDDMTPRELETAMGSALPDGMHGLLGDAVSVFEVANYSVHDIKRPEYEKMYLSRIGIKIG
jgi:hypothetical protein